MSWSDTVHYEQIDLGCDTMRLVLKFCSYGDTMRFERSALRCGTYHVKNVSRFIYIYIGLLGMTQLTRKLPIALGLILRGSPGPTA